MAYAEIKISRLASRPLPALPGGVLVPRPVEAMSEQAICDLLGPPASTIMPVHQEPICKTPAPARAVPVLIQQRWPRAKPRPAQVQTRVRICYALCPYCHTYFSDASEITRRITPKHP